MPKLFPPTSDLMSDGKRMRVIWKPGDGDGDSSYHHVERSLNTIKGHPTWKLFVDEVAIPIVRGSENEPPHYCYLDDRACYAVYCSREEYSPDEMRKFWPWDFDHQHHVRQGRKNRGHPAYLDDSCTEFAKGELRLRDKWYTFSGAPDISEYQPLRSKKATKMEKQVTQEHAKEGADSLNSEGDRPERNRLIPGGASERQVIPRSAGDRTISDEDENAPSIPLSRIFENDQTILASTRSAISRPTSVYGPKPPSLPPRSVSGTPHDNAPRARPHANSQIRPGSLAHLDPSSPQSSERTPTRSLPLKRDYVSSSESHIDFDSSPKRGRILPPPPSKGSSRFGGDGTSDVVMRDVGNGVEITSVLQQTVNGHVGPSQRAVTTRKRFIEPDEEPGEVARTQLRMSTKESELQDRINKLKFDMARLRGQNKTLTQERDQLQSNYQGLQARNLIVSEERDQLKLNNEELQAHLISTTNNRDKIRHTAVMLLASKLAQQHDLSQRVISFQELSDSFGDLAKQVVQFSMAAKKQVDPTIALCEGIGTVLDEPGKFMHQEGMDEEWKRMQDDAAKMN